MVNQIKADDTNLVISHAINISIIDIIQNWQDKSKNLDNTLIQNLKNWISFRNVNDSQSVELWWKRYLINSYNFQNNCTIPGY
jgi:hypothetical protein